MVILHLVSDSDDGPSQVSRLQSQEPKAQGLKEELRRKASRDAGPVVSLSMSERLGCSIAGRVLAAQTISQGVLRVLEPTETRETRVESFLNVFRVWPSRNLSFRLL